MPILTVETDRDDMILSYAIAENSQCLTSGCITMEIDQQLAEKIGKATSGKLVAILRETMQTHKHLQLWN